MKSEYHKLNYNGSGWAEWWGEDGESDFMFFHRIDGPAIITYHPDGTIDMYCYYILCKLVSKKDFYKPGFIDSFIMENS